MTKKNSVIIISLLFFLLTISFNVGSSNNFTDKNSKTITILNNSYLEEINGIKILHLDGSYYEMGYQQGCLLKNEIQSNFRALNNLLKEKSISYEYIVESWNQMKDYLPQCYIDEMQGVADGSDLSFENISAHNIGWYLIVNCGSFSAWGSATADGRLYYVRSSDFPITVKDPESGIFIQENQVILVRKPDNAYASLSPCLAGEVGTESGINEKQICTGMLSSWSYDVKLEGICIGFRMRMVLDFAANDKEAVDIITSNTTLGFNTIISDGKIPIGYAIEKSANHFYVGTWNNQSESTKPFWAISDVVRRANIYVDPIMSETQREKYNPSFLPLISTLLHQNLMGGKNISASTTWLHYVALSKGIERNWGKIDLNISSDIIRNVYLGKTDFRFFLLQKLKTYSTMYQWVACPETGDIIVSFATKDKNAFEAPLNRLNFYEILKN